MIDRGLTIIGLAGTVLSFVVPHMWPRIPRQWAYVGTGASAILLVLGLVMLLVPAGAQSPLPSAGGNCISNGNGNNYTGNDCSSKIINQAPKPQLEVLKFSRATNPDGGVTDTFLVQVKSPYIVPRLTIEVVAPDIQNVYVNPVGGGGKSQIRSWRDETGFVYSFGGAYGQYNVIVIKTGQSKTNLEHSFN